MNDGVYGSFSCVMYDHQHPIGRKLDVVGGTPAGTAQKLYWTTLWGPTCDGLDKVVEKDRMPLITEGDWIVFENMGAYTLAAGSEFNGMPRPQVFYYITGSVNSMLLTSLVTINKQHSIVDRSASQDISHQPIDVDMLGLSEDDQTTIEDDGASSSACSVLGANDQTGLFACGQETEPIPITPLPESQPVME